MIPGDKELWAIERKSRQTSLQRISITCGRVADDQQHIKIHRVHPIDQLIGQASGFAVVVVQIGGGENPHLKYLKSRCDRLARKELDDGSLACMTILAIVTPR